MHPESREPHLLHAFTDLAYTLDEDYDVAEMLHRLTRYCIDLLGVSAAGVLLSDRREGLRVIASSDERAQVLEAFQLHANEGPCVECFRTGTPLSIPNLRAEGHRWPTFAAEAGSLGYASMYTTPLRSRHEIVGALNLFGSHTGHLSDADQQLANALAEIATVAILSSRAIRDGWALSAQLQTALDTRTVIEQAKGLIAHAGKLPIDETFTLLRVYGRAHSTRLSEIAQQLVAGTLPVDEVLTYQPRAQSESGKRRQR